MFQLNSAFIFFRYTFTPLSFSQFGLGWGLFWGSGDMGEGGRIRRKYISDNVAF